jgi:transposase
MLLELADQGGASDTLMINATHRKTHHTASSLGLKKGGGHLIGRTKGGMNFKLHTATDAAGRPLRMFRIDGQWSDYIGVRALLNSLPPAEHMLADLGYDADWYCKALEGKRVTQCIPSQRNRKVPIPMTNFDTASPTRSRTVKPDSKTGGASQRVITAAPKSTCQHAHWLRSSCSGDES